VSFGTLVVIVLAGLGGPLLALTGRFIPVAIGEIVAGVVVGRTALEAVNPANPTILFLGQAGFAMLMLTVGMPCRCAIGGCRTRRAGAPCSR
jgi:Kef-type K+ transport system membrane component KefB